MKPLELVSAVSAGAALIAAAACGGSSKSSTDQPEGPAAGADVVEVTLSEVGLSSDDVNRQVDPCDDFFEYACGGWLERTEIPSDRGRYGRFHEIHDRVMAELRSILEAAAAADDADPATAAIGDYYAACMDEAAVDEKGLEPIDDLLGAVRGVSERGDVADVVTELHRHQIWALFSIDSSPDYKDSTSMIGYVDQAGLGLPDRDFYLNDDESSEALRESYRAHVARMFALLGASERAAERAAGHVMHIETELAKASKTREERRDLENMYNKIDREGLEEIAGGFPWAGYLEALGQPHLEDIVVTAPDFFARVDALIRDEPPAAWRSYLSWHLVHGMAHALPERFVEEDFKLTAALSGQDEIEPRWRRCIDAVDGALGEYLARPFVERAFSKEARDDADRMVAAISEAFEERVTDIDWMTDATVERALEKLGAMEHLVGYPGAWEDYDFDVSREAFAANELAARAFELHRELGLIGEPVDRGRWYMTPQTVNAYYSPLFNQMVFPAAILQPPFFSADYHTPVNLGAIGMVIGHELTHGFDDNGARFDARGNMENWWQAEDKAQFEARGQCVVEQYSGYEALPGLSLRGEVGLGENIADIGGVRLAFQAYRKLREGADEVYVADGHTEDQQFFLAMGRAWCAESREADLRRRVTVGPHSPERFRVNGSLANVPAFAEAFECEEGSPMNPERMCEVW